jgi:glycosyltransferase involved in cell wall biosynthesis
MGKPYFVRSHGSLDPFDLKKRALLKRILGPLFVRPLLARSAGVICTTELEAERLVTYGAKPRRWVVSLPVPFPDVSGAAGVGFRREFGIPEDAQVVLFLSRVDYKKGLEFLIPALGVLKKRFPKLWFVLAGTGRADYVAETRGMIDRMGLRPWTTETGFISGKAKEGAFNAANLLALPSLNENFGIVLVEAMAAGLPLLISDQVYIHKEVTSGQAGWVCETSVTSCQEHLEVALLDAEGLRRRGANAQALAHRHFGVAAATEGLVSIYQRGMAGE